MGEAKDKKARASLVVDMHVSREELVNLMLYLVRPVARPDGGIHMRGTKTRDERKRLERVLDQLGVLDIYDNLEDGMLTAEQRKAIPEVQVRPLTMETVEHLLSNVLQDMSHSEGLNLRKFERRLEDVKDEKYKVPGEYVHLLDKPADDEEPETLPPPAAAG